MATTKMRFDERGRAAFAMGGALTELMFSAGAFVLALVAMVGVMPMLAASLATVALGVGLVLESGAIGARFWKTLRSREGDSLTLGDVFGGVTAELFAGVVGIAFGVIAAFGYAPMAFIATSVIIYSAGLLLGCAALTHGSVAIGHADEAADEMEEGGSRDTLFAAASGQLVAGILGAALGIVALLGIETLSLSLIAILCIAASEVLSGGALGSRMLRVVKRTS